MFHKITKDLTKQLAPDGDLVPVCSFIDHDHFRPSYLVRRKPKKKHWMTRRYYKTGFTIQQILVPGEDRNYLDVQDSSSVTIMDCVDGRVNGSVKLPNNPGIIKATGAASMQQMKSVKVKTARINPADFELLKDKRKIDMNHSLIKQLRERRENLYVITEAVLASEETTLYESIAMEGSILNKLYVNFSLKGTRDSKKSTVLPKDCVLAFRVMPLLIEDESWGISYLPADKTFVSDGEEGGGLQGEVEEECAEFLQLSTSLRAKFLKSVIALLINGDLLQELELKLEEAIEDVDKCKLKSENPDLEDMLNTLQDSAGNILLELAMPVLYTLHALCELTEDHLLWLALSVEKKIVSKQYELVKSIVKQDFHLKGAFSLDADLVSPLDEEELNITKEMIELVGVTLQGNGPYLTGTGDPAALSIFSALYVALYVLHHLSRSD